jgi:hypothetical protein
MKVLIDYPISYCIPIQTFSDFILTVPYHYWYSANIELINELLIIYMGHLTLTEQTLKNINSYLIKVIDIVNPVIILLPITVYQESTIRVLPDNVISWDFTALE